MFNNASAPKVKLPEPKTDMKDHGHINKRLRGEPKNTSSQTPVMANTGNMKTAGVMKENAVKLAKYIVSVLKEDARSKKYPLSYNVIQIEGKKSKRRRSCPSMAEAIADVEECLQFNESKNVRLQVNHHGRDGSIVFSKYIPMIRVANHSPLMAEGRFLFRFATNADRFANRLVSEGIGCRLEQHNWGYAVKPYKKN